MERNPRAISLRQSFLAIAVIAIIVSTLLLVFSSLSSRRQESIHQQYQSETDSYIAGNLPGLKELFMKVFPNEADTCLVQPPDINSCAALANDRRSQIDRLIGTNLRDFSSTMFVKLNSRQELLVMRLSGDVRPLSVVSPEQETSIRRLLEGKLSSIPWDYYSTELSTKEIYIPFRGENGRIFGVIVRGIIE